MPKSSGKNVFNVWIYSGKLVYIPVSSLAYSDLYYYLSEKVYNYPTLTPQVFHYFHTVKNDLLSLVICTFSPLSTPPTINYQKGKI